MNSIRWIRNIVADGHKYTLEILIGADLIADKCYVRINQEPELWFSPGTDERDIIVQHGIDILKKRFGGLTITLPNGQPFNWE
jgi:hypothetical protein